MVMGGLTTHSTGCPAGPVPSHFLLNYNELKKTSKGEVS